MDSVQRLLTLRYMDVDITPSRQYGRHVVYMGGSLMEEFLSQW